MEAVLHNADLKAAFTSFATFGGGNGVELDGKAFVKLLKDAKLIGGKAGGGVTTTEADLIFARAKPKGGRKLDFHALVAALELVAQKRGAALAEVVALAAAAQPVDGGTVAEPVRFHDDKNLYTGVYARGGPTNVDMDPHNLAAVLDRTPADVRGVKTSGVHRRTTGGSSITGGGSPAGSRRATTESAAAAAAPGRIAAARRSTGEAKH